MIEATLIGYLRNELGVHVSASVPRDRPQRFVTVERTGGALDQFRDLPMFAVQAWGVSAAGAASPAGGGRKARRLREAPESGSRGGEGRFLGDGRAGGGARGPPGPRG